MTFDAWYCFKPGKLGKKRNWQSQGNGSTVVDATSQVEVTVHFFSELLSNVEAKTSARYASG